MTDAQWRPDFKPEDDNWAYEAKNGVRIYCLGVEGEWLFSFQKVTTQEFLDAVYEYELTVESYDSKAEWPEEEGYKWDDVTVRAVEYKPHDERFDTWGLSWGPDSKFDTLVTILNRW